MNDKSVVECLVIGSGLVAHELWELWNDSDGDLRFVDMSGLAQTKVVSKSPAVFDENLIVKTAKVGGGSLIWGGKVTIPTKENWFAPNLDHLAQNSWLEFGNFVSTSIVGNEGTEFLRQVNKGLSRFASEPQSRFRGAGMSPDRHIFLPEKQSYDSKVEEFAVVASKVSAILKFQVHSSGGSLIFEDETGTRHDVEFRKLVLASGPIANSMVLSIITAQNTFSIGNHAQATVGRLHLDRVAKFGHDAYLRHGKSFYSGSSQVTERGRGDHSIRLVPDGSRALSLASLNFGSKSFLSDLIGLLYLRAGFASSFEIFGMADIQYAGELKIQTSKDGERIDSLSISIKDMVNSSEILEELRNLALNAGSLPRVKQLSVRKNAVLYDAAHYFGTIPMRDEPTGNEVSSFFKVEGLQQTWSLGASGFPTGSHGHPTLLSILTAHRALDSIRAPLHGT